MSQYQRLAGDLSHPSKRGSCILIGTLFGEPAKLVMTNWSSNAAASTQREGKWPPIAAGPRQARPGGGKSPHRCCEPSRAEARGAPTGTRKLSAALATALRVGCIIRGLVPGPILFDGRSVPSLIAWRTLPARRLIARAAPPPPQQGSAGPPCVAGIASNPSLRAGTPQPARDRPVNRILQLTINRPTGRIYAALFAGAILSPPLRAGLPRVWIRSWKGGSRRKNECSIAAIASLLGCSSQSRPTESFRRVMG